MKSMRSTTIVAVRREGKVAIAADGQVTMGQTIMKHGARKLRRMYQNRVLAGFAGSVADAQTLADKFESKLEAAGGNLTRAAIDFAKEWRTDRMMRRLEAFMIVADAEHLYLLSGDGNILEPDDGVGGLVDGVHPALGHRPVGGDTGRPRPEPERPLVADAGRVARGLGHHDRTSPAEHRRARVAPRSRRADETSYRRPRVLRQRRPQR